MLQSDRMVTRVLTVYQFPLDTQKTGNNLRLSLNRTAELLSLTDTAAHFYFVTDQGSNIKSALSGTQGRNHWRGRGVRTPPTFLVTPSTFLETPNF